MPEKPDSQRRDNEQSTGQLAGSLDTKNVPIPIDIKVNAFHFSKQECSGLQNTDNQTMRMEDVQNWVQDSLELARNPTATPAIRLLVAFTPALPAQDRASFLRHVQYRDEEVRRSLRPAIEGLQLPKNLPWFPDSVVIDKIPLYSTRTEEEEDPNLDFIYYIGFGDCSLLYRHFPESKTSIGVAAVEYRSAFSQLTAGLVMHQKLIGHPYILPFAVQRAINFRLCSWLKDQADAIVEAQEETGYHAMSLFARSGKFVDYSQLSARMTGVVINIATFELCWAILIEHGDILMDGDITSTTGSKAAALFQYEVRRFKRAIQMNLLDAKSCGQRGTILLQGIFNLIAQQDQNTSIGIAEDSRTLAAEAKRDSTSMKTLAVVTMAFLPGAFVAAVLAIPIFQWDAINISDIVNHRFWIYWSITVPLTFLTFLAWFVWIRYAQRSVGEKEKDDFVSITSRTWICIIELQRKKSVTIAAGLSERTR